MSNVSEGDYVSIQQHAFHSHRDRIQQMRALPPHIMDEDRRQLQIRCAAAEEKAENLKMEHGASGSSRKSKKAPKRIRRSVGIGSLQAKGECGYQAGWL